jgi:cyclase
MLARRIIPCLDVRDGRVVKGTRFTDIQDVDDPKALGKRYSDEGADELVFYDIPASAEARAISLSFVAEVAKEINIPFCVGGGIRTIEDMTTVLRHGADKVSINSAAIANPDLIDAGARKFGSQCIVLSMDVKEQDGRYYVYQNGGRVNTGIDAIEWAQEGVRRGAGELVINSMNFDGTKQGFDIELLNKITSLVSVPVIASGGAGSIEHFLDLARSTDVDGYLAASVFHFGEIRISDLKRDLAEAGIPIRQTR